MSRSFAIILAGFALGAALAVGGAVIKSETGRETDEKINVAIQRVLDERTVDLRDGCERSKDRSRLNAEGWRMAQAARKADGDDAVAARYGEIAKGLEALARTNCADEYPRRKVEDLPRPPRPPEVRSASL